MSKPVISAFDWVPDFAKGQVRDLVARWAFEEMGVEYDTHLLNARQPRGPDYVAWHAFDQVPAFRDGEVELFESGAILLYLAEKHGKLLPTDPAGRGKVTSWLFATLNTVEPNLRPVSILPLFHSDKDWAQGAADGLRPLAEKRLQRVSDALGDAEWIAGDFSIADILLVFVLRSFGADMIDAHANLVAYRDRGVARPAFQRALAAQIADFQPQPMEA